MGNLKSYKYWYDGRKFSSQGEVEMYKLLKSMGIDFKDHPEKINIIPKFEASSGKKYVSMNYEPDFSIQTDIKCRECEACVESDDMLCDAPKIIYIEVKGNNDMVYTFRKGQKPSIMDKSDLYRIKHRIIDKVLSEQGDIFMVVRHSNLKTPEYAGLFFDKDWEQLKKFKTQGKKELCKKVPRIKDRLAELLQPRLDI